MCPADSPLCKSQEVATFTSIHGSPVTGKAPKRCPGATERPDGLVLTLLCTFWELGRLAGLEKHPLGLTTFRENLETSSLVSTEFL